MFRRDPHELALTRAVLRGIYVFALLIVAWLFVHRYITLRHDTSPWKLGGMAMYIVGGPKFELDWFQRYEGADLPMTLSERDRDFLFVLDTSPADVSSFGALTQMGDSAQFLMHSRQAVDPIVGSMSRQKYSFRRMRYIDRSCRHEFIYEDGEMLENRACRSLSERIVEVEPIDEN